MSASGVRNKGKAAPERMRNRCKVAVINPQRTKVNIPAINGFPVIATIAVSGRKKD